MTKDTLQPNLLEYHLGNDVIAFSTTRDGGKSVGLYSEFNITHYCNDDPEHVLLNRQLLCDKLGIHDNCLLLPRQTHSDHVRYIDNKFLESPSEIRTQLIEDTDALITNIPGLCIGVSTADCIPILLFDPVHRTIAAIHAGWRGTVSHIVNKAIEAMQATYGTIASDLKAVIGPGISQAAFEVGNEVYEQFEQANFPMSDIAALLPGPQGKKWHIDLWAANFFLLEEAGLPLSSIQVCGICTYTEHERFFSARRLGINSGRIFNGIMLQ